MAVDVLQVLGRLAVDVARQVEVEVVLLDLLERHHAGVPRDVEPPGEDVDDLVDVLGAQAVLGAVLHEARLASIMKMPLRAWASSLSTTTMQAGMPVP